MYKCTYITISLVTTHYRYESLSTTYDTCSCRTLLSTPMYHFYMIDETNFIIRLNIWPFYLRCCGSVIPASALLSIFHQYNFPRTKGIKLRFR